MSQIEKGRTYTPDELNILLGPTWISSLSASYPPQIQKNVVYTYSDFNNEVKNVYNTIYNLIKQLNPESNFSVFAVGDYVSGKWKTVNEANQQSEQYQVIVTPSSYSFWSDAKVIPHDIELADLQSDAPIKFDPTNNTHKVIIPPQN